MKDTSTTDLPSSAQPAVSVGNKQVQQHQQHKRDSLIVIDLYIVYDYQHLMKYARLIYVSYANLNRE
jgi:hypothetical protein